MDALSVLKWLGVALLFGGGLSFILPPFLPFFAFVLIFIGAILILSVMIIERYREWKEMREKISEEDLRP